MFGNFGTFYKRGSSHENLLQRASPEENSLECCILDKAGSLGGVFPFPFELYIALGVSISVDINI